MRRARRDWPPEKCLQQLLLMRRLAAASSYICAALAAAQEYVTLASYMLLKMIELNMSRLARKVLRSSWRFAHVNFFLLFIFLIGFQYVEAVIKSYASGLIRI